MSGPKVQTKLELSHGKKFMTDPDLLKKKYTFMQSKDKNRLIIYRFFYFNTKNDYL